MTKFEISVITMPLAENENFVTTTTYYRNRYKKNSRINRKGSATTGYKFRKTSIIFITDNRYELKKLSSYIPTSNFHTAMKL